VSYCTDHLSAGQREQIARDCFQVTDQRGSELHGLCPFHAEKKASFSYNFDKDLCNCLSCGSAGDLISLWGQSRGYADNDSAFAAFSKQYGPDKSADFCHSHGKRGGASASGGQGGTSEMTKIIPDSDFDQLPELTEAWKQRCSDQYGWSKKVIAQLRLKPGTPERLAIPIRQDDGALVNIRLYAPGDENKMISWGKGFGKSKLFPSPSQWKKTPIIICEGEKDCLTAISKGFNAVTQTAGCNSWADQFTRFFRGRKVIIAYDADEKGLAGAQKVAKKLTGTAKEIRIISWPEELMPLLEDHGQDLTDYFTTHRQTAQDLRNLITKTAPESTSQPGDDDGDVQRFFGGDRGKQFRPRLVCDEITTWRRLINDPKSGMIYTWEDTHWQEYDPSNIRRRILDLLKIEGTTPRVNDVFGIVKDLSIMPHGRTMNDQQNQIPILNGMFSLENGQVSDHDPDNLNTYIIDLHLDLSGELPKCEKWQDFLSESVNDADTIRELQKFFGYCLTRETRHEKALLLIGPGGDGKGTILKMLSALVGEVNTGNVTLGGLQDQFHRVMLVDKLLNVATEVEASLLQSDIFKTLISGESVTAAFKHKNAFSFLPVCKLAFSSNKHPNIQDTSDGLYRRLLVIEMEKQFVKHGKADLYLFDKLIEERSGVFLWALRGLQLLREEGFTPSDYMSKCLDQFQEINNPILSFSRHHVGKDPGGFLCTMDMYRKYQKFCEKRGYKPLGESRFGIELRKVVPEARKKRESTGKRRWGYADICIEDDYEVQL